MCLRRKKIVIEDIRMTNPWLFIPRPRGRTTTVKDNLESMTLQANLRKIVRMLNRGIRQRAIAERVDIRRSTLKRFVRELRRS